MRLTRCELSEGKTLAPRPSHSPTVRHKRLTAELRRLRADSGLTRDDVAGRLDWHPTKITRIETGQWTRLNPRDVRDLLDIYGVTGEAQREALLQLARDARQRGWWHSYGDVLPSEYTHFIGLETEAASVRTYQQVLVPGLLQTERYTRAVVQAFRPTDTEEGTDRRTAVRLQRQRRVLEEHTLQLSAVLGEGVIRQHVGEPDVMAEQLRFLADTGSLPNVMIHVLPYAAGAHGAMTGSFAILGFPEPVDPDVIYLENMASALFLEEPDDVASYVQVFDYLRAAALSPRDSADMLRTAAEELL
jgi:transcriptional regulator with XRE-family HTH domain